MQSRLLFCGIKKCQNIYVSINIPTTNFPLITTKLYDYALFCDHRYYNLKFPFRSGRESYGDDAVGYVQLKRDQNTCIVKCTICPEHKVRSKPYAVSVVVNEAEESVTSVQCHDCPASEGGCKHGVAFLMWLHRRTEDPSCTSVECYWRKSNLAKVGSSIKVLTASEISKRKVRNIIPDNSVLKEFVQVCKKRKIKTCQFLRHEQDFNHNAILSLHHLMMNNGHENCDDFLKNISIFFNKNNISAMEKQTRGQDKSSMWHELRYGRITASKCYEVSRCKTVDGTLIAIILGARIPETSAILRGKKLEDKVRKTVEKIIGNKIDICGLYISEQFPMIAGSPDGINDKTTFEIKCPSTEKTHLNYIDKDGVITARYYAQVQIQMYCANRNKCYFCVASSDFEKNNEVSIINIDYDHDYVTELLDNVVSFWKNNIFPILHKSVMLDS